jgi:hypothetical protein
MLYSQCAVITVLTGGRMVGIRLGIHGIRWTIHGSKNMDQRSFRYQIKCVC